MNCRFIHIACCALIITTSSLCAVQDNPTQPAARPPVKISQEQSQLPVRVYYAADYEIKIDYAALAAKAAQEKTAQEKQKKAQEEQDARIAQRLEIAEQAALAREEMGNHDDD